MAKMNMFLHDYTDALFAIGDTFTKPGFARGRWAEAIRLCRRQPHVEPGQLRRVPLRERPLEPLRPVRTASSADWGWVHTCGLAKRKGTRSRCARHGRGLTRLGSKSSNKEKTIRQAFVEADLIEGVVLLPENLFYNTPAPGIVVLLNRHKHDGRRGHFLLINASAFFVKKKPKNELTDDGIAAVAEVFQRWESRERLSRVVTLEQVRKADYNLSPSLFVAINGKVTHRALSAIVGELISARQEREEADKELDAMLRSLSLMRSE